MTIPPRPAHTHTWDGHTLPTWLTTDQHHHDDGQLVIHTPDGEARPDAGWWLIGWTNGTVTVASPWTGRHVYGPAGAYQQLAQAEAQLRQIRRLRDDLNDTTGGAAMTDRHTVDSITSDALDELYDDLARYEEVQGEMNERAIDLTRRAERAEAALARIRRLEARLWDNHDPQTRPVSAICHEIANDIRSTLATEHASTAEHVITRVRKALDSVKAAGRGHTPTTPYDKGVAAARDWVVMRVLEAIDARLVPAEQPARTTPNNPTTSKDNP